MTLHWFACPLHVDCASQMTVEEWEADESDHCWIHLGT